MKRFALGVEYDGEDFHGWQKQDAVRSVQTVLEKAISQVADHPITVYCAGRTDAGVHAQAQVIHFESEAQRSIDAWLSGTNAYLPHDVRVQWAKEMPIDFHARFSATARTYRYYVYLNRVFPAVLRQYVHTEYRRIDETLMQAAALDLLGEQDFSTFRSGECQSKTPMRHLQELKITRYHDLLVFQLTANAFLHHMVRKIVGVLLEIGAGAAPVDWAKTLLMKRDYMACGVMAPAKGLHLYRVTYPSRYDLPMTKTLWHHLENGMLTS